MLTLPIWLVLTGIVAILVAARVLRFGIAALCIAAGIYLGATSCGEHAKSVGDKTSTVINEQNNQKGR